MLGFIDTRSQDGFDRSVPLANLDARKSGRAQVVRDIVGFSVMLALLAVGLVLKLWAYLPHGGLQ